MNMEQEFGVKQCVPESGLFGQTEQLVTTVVMIWPT